MLDRMGLDQDSVMIIHMGGVYGDKAATLKRFKKVYGGMLSDRVKRRLVLENDEVSLICLFGQRLICHLAVLQLR